MISRPVFFTILASFKPLTHYLLYFFIHCLIELLTTLANFDSAAITPSDLGPLESHIYYGIVRSGIIVKPIYYIGGILSFYLIDSGALI